MSIQSVERRRASRGWCAEAVSLFLILILALSFSVAHAATFTVTNLNDGGAGSLRQAVLDANAAGGVNIITFQSGLRGTITLTSGQIVISNNNLTVNGPGATTLAISGNGASRIFEIDSGATVVLDKLTLKEGYDPTHGGAIYNAGTLAITGSTLADNGSSGVGGAISNGNTLTVTASTLSGNSARYGGCIDNGRNPPTSLTIADSVLSHNSAYEGGCIHNSSALPVTITNSTLSGNMAEWDGAGIYIAESAGIVTVRDSVLFDNTATGGGGGIYNRATLVVSNSTVSGNAATTGDGGGLWSGGNSRLTVSQTTVTDNAAHVSGGGLWLYGARTTIGNSLVAGNSAPTGKEVRQDNSTAGGAFSSQGHNLFGENGAAGVDGVTLSADDLILAGSVTTAIDALANNGGQTLTHLPVAGSPAINAGSNSLISAGVTTDQRGDGFPRIVGGTVDIGAVEFGGSDATTHALTVSKSGGNGTITSNPAGIHCGATCSANFNSGTAVTLTASADSGYSFTGWSGDCSGTSNTCMVTMDRAKSVTALFTTTSTHTLITTTAGTGSGTVSGAGSYAAGAMVNLTATPSAGSTFAGWSPSPCAASFAMPANNLTCTATFNDSAPNTYPLTLTTAGSGSGTVGGAGSYAAGAMVTLTATPNAGSTFVGWSPSPCASLFSMPANALTCTANFTGPTGSGYPLTVALAGNGVGSIVSQPSGIRCSNISGDSVDCNATYPANTAVTLTPTLATGASYFAGWSGACTGTGACTVTMSGPQSVTATLATGYALTVIRNEGGTVTRSPAGSNCTTAAGGITEQCIYAPNTAVTLTAVPAAIGVFSGWTGACSGTGPCTVTMTANQTVTAAFTSSDPVTSLITHYYQSITERAPDPGGLTFWQGLVAERQANNQDVKEVFRQIADFFFSSDEYLGRNTTDRQFITNLYLTFFQRAPDEGGYAFWLGQLAQGMSRNQAMRGFLYSPEFTDFMERTLNP